MDISVVIATYNRSELLSRTVPALLAQQIDGFDFEVIFVDDGSTDETSAILNRVVTEHPEVFRYIRGSHSGSPAAPRNLGIRHARGEVILLLDDDVIPDDQLILEHWRFHQRETDPRSAVTGKLYLPPEIEADPMSIFHSFPYDGMKVGTPLEFYYFWTCNVSLKRTFMLAHGMFDEDSALYPLEDMECGYRLVEAGLRLEFLPQASGQHIHKMKPEWVPAKGQRLGRAQFAVTQKVRDVRMKKWLALASPDLPYATRLWRLVKRGILRTVDNPITLFGLRCLGAERPRRSRVTDLFYYLKFRRNVISAYHAAVKGQGVRRPVRVFLSAWAVLLFASLACVRPGVPAVTTPPEPGSITVHPEKSAGTISPYIYGVGIEWIDYGNFILDPKSGSLRRELIEPLKALRIPVWRFPGGILSDHYHWQDGIGPPDRRPKGRNPMDNKEHANAFGTDEFIELCKQVGSEALVTANAGTGTLQELLSWQAYFAGKGFPVKYWEIGNEIYLAEDSSRATVPGNDRRIFKNADTYASQFNQWAHGLREHDPNVVVGGIAGTENTSTQNRGWLPRLLAGSGDQLDFLALHNAFAPLIFGSYDFSDTAKAYASYEAMFARAAATAEDTRSVSEQLAKQRRSGPMRIAITEHFPLFGGGGDQKQILAILDQSKTLASAIFTASLLHEFMREKVWMANYNIATSKWFGALLTDTDQGIIRTPTYFVYDLYRNHFGTKLVDISVRSPTFDSGKVGTVAARAGVPYLDAVASRDESGNLYLAVINRNLRNAVEADIDIPGVSKGRATVRVLSGPSPRAINGPAFGRTVEPHANISIQSSTWEGKSGTRYRFPASSISIFNWKEST